MLLYKYITGISDKASVNLLLGLGGLLVKRDHELVPVHRILSGKEVSQLLASMGIGIGNLPKILIDDPQAKKIGANVGDVLELDRQDFGKSYKYYRHVVA